MPSEVVVEAVAELTARFVAIAEAAAREAIAARGVFTLAVPGGSAAEALLPPVAKAAIDWQRTHLFWVDERAVPPDSPQSNFHLAKGALIEAAKIPADHVHRMRAEDPNVDDAAAEYAAALAGAAGRPPALDLVLLGMGPDGHVASLFPGHALLRAWDRDVATLSDSPKDPPRRMTLTLRTLTAARRIVVFATGRSKAEAILNALGDVESDLPIALATMGDAPATFLLDQAAASGLSR